MSNNSNGIQSNELGDLTSQLMEALNQQAVARAVKEEQVTVPDDLSLNSLLDFNQVLEVLNKYGNHKATYCDQDVYGHAIAEVKSSMQGFFIQVTMMYLSPFGASKYTEQAYDFQIPHFKGKVRLGSLPVYPVFDESEEEEFIIRGLKFQELTKDQAFKHAEGYMYVPGRFEMIRLPLNSRIIVDPEGYHKFNSANRWHDRETMDSIPDEMLSLTMPTVPVFSLEYKKWGEVPVAHIRDIIFDETAFDRVVLTDEYKKTVKTLVSNFYLTECTDFIAGKKRGLVFLLNGPPGTGKTLTAQSVAELTHKPLYSVGSGDLGTDAQSIENSLKKIFDMVGHWNGIVLLDEADVFMATRVDYDITYNSCVSVFLRLVESYFGILFLTTNRDSNIDSAFDSRVHIKLKYDRLNAEERGKVWEESLYRYKITNVDFHKLKEHDLNNREIANVVQLGYIESGGKPENVTTEMLEILVKLRKVF